MKKINKEKERLALANFMVRQAKKQGFNLLNQDGTIATTKQIADRANETFNNPDVIKMINDFVKTNEGHNE